MTITINGHTPEEVLDFFRYEAVSLFDDFDSWLMERLGFNFEMKATDFRPTSVFQRVFIVGNIEFKLRDDSGAALCNMSFPYQKEITNPTSEMAGSWYTRTIADAKKAAFVSGLERAVAQIKRGGAVREPEIKMFTFRKIQILSKDASATYLKMLIEETGQETTLILQQDKFSTEKRNAVEAMPIGSSLKLKARLIAYPNGENFACGIPSVEV